MPLSDRAKHLRRVATALAGAGARRLIRRSDDDDARLGEALLAELDEMKGLAMKVGQMMSYLDTGLPEATLQALSVLQTGVVGIDLDAVDAVLVAALGAPSEALFDRFDPTPVAAASIGQVHRAWLDGAPVAVKVQYPGVAETFASDTGRLRRIASLASLATSVDGQAIVDDLAARLAEECDYLAEAAHTEAFAEAWAADDEVGMPTVLRERSASTVLTTSWVEGVGLDAMAEAPDEVRQRAARTLTRFAWTNLFHRGTIHADPHPGNQIFAPDGSRITWLDFGCVHTFRPEIVQAERDTLRALMTDDRALLHDAIRVSGVVGSPRFDPDAHADMLRWLWAPYLTGASSFTEGWMASGRHFTRPTNPNLRHMAVPPHWTWMQRLQFGLHGVLTRLGARGDYRALMEEILATQPADASLPPEP